MLVVTTAGERLAVEAPQRWVERLIAEGLGGEATTGAVDGATVVVRVESRSQAFDVTGWEPLTRGAWHRAGQVVITDACGSGFDVHVAVTDGRPVLTARWRPRPAVRAASVVLRGRFHLLARAVLLQYPVLWWAGVMGRAPLHVGGLRLGPATAVLSGPAGIGKSTLLSAAVAEGAEAVGDNLCVSDGERIWGLVEPVRTVGGTGRRMPHGRREAPWSGRADTLRPDQLLVLRRGGGDRFTVAPLDAEQAARDLVCSTYAAGELRRYWAFAALLAAGTGLGPAHPAVTDTADRLAAGLVCRSLSLPCLSSAHPTGLRLCLESAS